MSHSSIKARLERLEMKAGLRRILLFSCGVPAEIVEAAKKKNPLATIIKAHTGASCVRNGCIKAEIHTPQTEAFYEVD